MADIVATTGNQAVEVVELDLLSLRSVRRFAQAFAARPEPLHILVNNAGVQDGQAGEYQDKLEVVTQTNNLSHFLLTNLLKDKLATAANARVINVSSLACLGGKVDLANINYETGSSQKSLESNYHNSKMMNVLFSQEPSRRWVDLGITSYSLSPGLVRWPDNTSPLRTEVSALTNLASQDRGVSTE